MDSWSSKPLPNLFGNQADQLTSVRLVGTTGPWNTKVLSGLNVLELVSIQHNYLTITVEDVLSILTSSPQLSVLKLSGIHFDEIAVEPSQPIIQLPLLTSLHLRLQSSKATTSFLRFIQAPSCQNLWLQALMRDVLIPDFPSFLNLVIPFIPQITPVAGYSRLILEFDHLQYTLRLPAGTPYALNISLDEIDTDAIIDTLFQILPPEFLGLETRLVYRGEHCPDELTQVLETVNRMPVTKLTMESVGRRTAGGVLDRLARSDPCWIFPALQQLYVDMRDIPSGTLVKMVRARQTASLAGERSDSPASFTRICTTEPQRRNYSDHAALEALVGMDVLAWNGGRDPDESGPPDGLESESESEESG